MVKDIVVDRVADCLLRRLILSDADRHTSLLQKRKRAGHTIHLRHGYDAIGVLVGTTHRA